MRHKFIVIERRQYEGDPYRIYFDILIGSRNKDYKDANIKKRHLCTLVFDNDKNEFKTVEKEEELTEYTKSKITEVLQNSMFIKRFTEFKVNPNLSRVSFYIASNMHESLEELGKLWRGE